MIGDRLIFHPEHYIKGKLICSEVMDNYFGDKIVVTIGGESGTGKSEVASILQDSLWNSHKVRGKIIHIDDYYFTPWQNRNSIRKKTGIIGIEEINWNKLKDILKTFRNGKKFLYVERIHMYTNSVEKIVANNKNIDILVIEGLYANYLEDKDLGIYLEGTYKETKAFREERQKEKINKFRMEVLEKEHKDILKTRKMSDIFIPFKEKK